MFQAEDTASVKAKGWAGWAVGGKKVAESPRGGVHSGAGGGARQAGEGTHRLLGTCGRTLRFR